MRNIRGLKVGKRLSRLTGWIFRRARIGPGYKRMSGLNQEYCRPRRKPISKLINWGRRLAKGARSLCSAKPCSGYVPVGYDSIEKPATVPKGHLAVYVGQKDGDFHRVLVPVIYFNHPLFCELLRAAENEYGFNHQGGITIPCPFSDFERVKTRIASASDGSRSGRCGGRATLRSCSSDNDDNIRS